MMERYGSARSLLVLLGTVISLSTLAAQSPVIVRLTTINTSGDDFAPVYEPSMPPRLWYTSQYRDPSTRVDRQRIMVADVVGGRPQGGRPLDDALNSGLYIGAVCWRSPRLIFAAAGIPGAMDDRTDLYASIRRRGAWDRAEPWTVMNSPLWDSHPSLSGDGALFLFASNRPGGAGGIDIWYSTYDTYKGMWNPPRNAGPGVNTPADEISPTIVADNRTLYFASNSAAYQGAGGFDMYRCETMVNSDGSLLFASPRPISEVNSPFDECFYYAIDSVNAYFSSNRDSYGGDLDIYSVTPNPAPPHGTLLRRFVVFDCRRNMPFGAGVDIFETVSGRQLPLARSDDGTGSLVLQLPPGEYSVVPVEPGYSGSTIIIDRESAPPERVDTIWVSPVGTWCDVIQAVPVKFETARWDIQPQYGRQLDQLARRLGPYMEANRETMVFIDGHTDVRGMDEYNWGLAGNRAEEVRAYLVTRMPTVDPRRIVATPYGESRPIYDVTGVPEPMRSRMNAVNRRIEMRITRIR